MCKVGVGFELISGFIEGPDELRAELTPLVLHGGVSLTWFWVKGQKRQKLG